MQLIPVKTKRFEPPQDDLISEIDTVLEERIQDGDVLVVTSKVVSIHEGRCTPVEGVEKEELVRDEADLYINEVDSRWPIVLKDNAFLVGAGIDESNADEHYILLPKNPFESAERIYSYIQSRFKLKDIGVLVVDSHSIPLRYGTVGVALGWWGFEPVTHFTGKPDLFGRSARFSRINVADALAVSAVFLMGEMDEQTPLCIARDIPHIEFTARDTSGNLFIPHREDIYWPLIKRFYESDN
ncbi:MAG: coenzyme F420-0:L-glutamate ligase [Candidatus Paceibacterota bacterium]